MEEKHETRPSAKKVMRKYRENIDVKSASNWDRFSLTRFHVDFQRKAHTALNTLIKGSKWYDPETEPTPDFLRRMTHAHITDFRIPRCSPRVTGYYRGRYQQRPQ